MKSMGWWKLAETITYYIVRFFLLKDVHLFEVNTFVIIQLSYFWFALFSKTKIMFENEYHD